MQKYQTLIPRFWALVLDSIILLPLFVIDETAKNYSFSPMILVTINVATSLAGVFYFILMHYFFGQTVGKMLTNVKVLDVSEKPLRFFQSVLRDLPQLIAVSIFLIFGNPELLADNEKQTVEFMTNPVANSAHILLVIWGIADIIVFFTNDKRRALHDYVAGSVVIKVKPAE